MTYCLPVFSLGWFFSETRTKKDLYSLAWNILRFLWYVNFKIYPVPYQNLKSLLPNVRHIRSIRWYFTTESGSVHFSRIELMCTLSTSSGHQEYQYTTSSQSHYWYAINSYPFYSKHLPLAVIIIQAMYLWNVMFLSRRRRILRGVHYKEKEAQ